MVERQHGTARTHSDDPITSEDERYELLDGKPSRARLRTAERHHVVGPLRTFVDVFAIKFDLGSVLARPTTVELSETNVTRPDIVFVAKERENILAEGVVSGAPDLVVEVFTPSVDKPDESNRRGLYARHGVEEYWQVDADIPEVRCVVAGQQGIRACRAIRTWPGVDFAYFERAVHSRWRPAKSVDIEDRLTRRSSPFRLRGLPTHTR